MTLPARKTGDTYATPTVPVQPPPPPRPSVAPKVKLPPPPPAQRQHVAKKFAIESWTGQGEGQKTVVYGGSGLGKTTLVTLLQQYKDRVVVVGLDDGGRLIRHGKTGDALLHVPGIETFQDVRDFLQSDLLVKGDVVVIDTITKLEELSLPFIFQTIKGDKGATCDNIEAYGFGKGYRYLLDTFRLVLSDLDALVRRGVDVVLLAQMSNAKIATAEGLDYFQEGPKLCHYNNHSSRLEVIEWADHVLRLALHDTTVVASGPVQKGGPTKGKIVGGEVRAIYTEGQAWYMAKSRTLTDPIVSYEDVLDDTIWSLIYGDKK